MRERITTALDVVGAGLIVSGVAVILGLGAALIAAGVITLVFSYWAAA